MANQQNEALIRRMLEMMNQPQLPPDFEQYFEPGFDSHVAIEGASGPQGYRAVYNFWHGPFPDVHMTVDHLFSDGDYVGAHWQVRGTHTGDFFGTPPTGKQVDVSVTGIFRCRNGKIAEGWVNPDRFGLMQQLGIVKAPDMSRRRAA